MICVYSKLVMSAEKYIHVYCFTKENCTFCLSMGLPPLFFPFQKRKKIKIKALLNCYLQAGGSFAVL